MTRASEVVDLSKITIGVQMAKDFLWMIFFQQFKTNWLQRYGPVVGYCMRITTLKTGITGDSFQVSGILSVDSERLKRLHRIGQMEEAVCFSIMLVISSTPAAELF